MESLEKAARITFGLFEVDLQSGEIWKSGYRVRLQDQPFRVLATLLTKPGQVVTHGELQLQVWGPDTNVDFERAIAVAIKKIREALSDSAENPRFVETLAKRGYRFIAPVTVTSVSLPPKPMTDQQANETNADGNSLETDAQRFIPIAGQMSFPARFPGLGTSILELDAGRDSPVAQKAARKKHVWTRREMLATLVSGLLLGLVAVLWLGQGPIALPPLRVEQITHDSPVAAGPPSMENLLTLATDGQRIFTSVLVDGRSQIAAIDISTGGVQCLRENGFEPRLICDLESESVDRG